MTTTYRTASAPTAPRAPWWRRALCAVGLHSLYLVSDRCAKCEHCPHETHEQLSLLGLLHALCRARDRHNEGQATPQESRFVIDCYRGVSRELDAGDP